MAIGGDASRWFAAGRGHTTPRRSRKVVLQGTPDPYQQTKMLKLKRSLEAAAKAKRIAKRKGKSPHSRTGLQPEVPCLKRFLEFEGLLSWPVQYGRKPGLIRRAGKFVYELWIGLVPFCSFTDWAEALASLESLQAHGYPSVCIKQHNLAEGNMT